MKISPSISVFLDIHNFSFAAAENSAVDQTWRMSSKKSQWQLT